MTLEEALTERIGADATLGRLLGEDGGWAMRLASLPGITLMVAADPRPQTMKGFQRVRASTVQVDAWGETKAEAARIREQLIALLVEPALVGVVQFQRAMVVGVRPTSAPEQSAERQRFRGHLARESIDFIFTHNAN